MTDTTVEEIFSIKAGIVWIALKGLATDYLKMK
jgi:hypothetical protein